MVKIKVLLVITLSELGGAQKVVYNIASGLSPEQFEITVACSPGGELVNWLRVLPQGIKVVEIPELKRNISPLNDLKAFYKLYSLMKKEGFHIVHCHSSKAGVLGRLAARLAGVPKIFFTVHGWGINEYQVRPARFFYTLTERFTGALSTGIVCVSQNDLEKGLRLRLASPDRLSVIYNGMPEPQKKKGVLRKELAIKEEDIIIGTVARLALQKDPLFLLNVAERMIASSNNRLNKRRIYFVIVGDGPLRLKCEEYIKRKGLEERVFLLGAREEAAELMQDFDVFVLFSRWEGLPLTVIEAMLAGVPVVANAVGGVGEMVVNNETGYLIDKLDVNEAEKALWDLVSNPGKRFSMGEAGRQRALKLFNVSRMVEEYKKLYTRNY
ncbi:MAG TPA: glycosyltransferase family 4 protein [Bacillota bacterium]|nr:glycosyltransferase family 4 protein [Bacillota bacterium]